MMLPMLMAGSTNDDAGDMVQMMLMMSMFGQGTPTAEAAPAAAAVEVPPQPKLVQEEIPADATKAVIVEITKRNNEALVAYQEAIAAWAKIVETITATKAIAPAAAPAANPMQMMMPMMMAQMFAKGGKGKDFFGKN